MRKVLLIPYTFVLLNWAAVAGLFHFALGHKNVWTRHERALDFSLSPKRPGERLTHGR